MKTTNTMFIEGMPEHRQSGKVQKQNKNEQFKNSEIMNNINEEKVTLASCKKAIENTIENLIAQNTVEIAKAIFGREILKAFITEYRKLKKVGKDSDAQILRKMWINRNRIESGVNIGAFKSNVNDHEKICKQLIAIEKDTQKATRERIKEIQSRLCMYADDLDSETSESGREFLQNRINTLKAECDNLRKQL